MSPIESANIFYVAKHLSIDVAIVYTASIFWSIHNLGRFVLRFIIYCILGLQTCNVCPMKSRCTLSQSAYTFSLQVCKKRADNTKKYLTCFNFILNIKINIIRFIFIWPLLQTINSFGSKTGKNIFNILKSISSSASLQIFLHFSQKLNTFLRF